MHVNIDLSILQAAYQELINAQRRGYVANQIPHPSGVWTPVAQSIDGSISSIDFPTRMTDGVNVLVWERHDYTTVQNLGQGNFITSLALVQYSCYTREQTLHLITNFDSSGNLVSALSQTQTAPIQPGSVAELTWIAVCQALQTPYLASSQLNALNVARQTAANSLIETSRILASMLK